MMRTTGSLSLNPSLLHARGGAVGGVVGGGGAHAVGGVCPVFWGGVVGC